MNILVTAGNTIVPIDRVRCITNVFTGRTGTQIAMCGHERGHNVTLLTSHPEVVAKLSSDQEEPSERWSARSYQTFDDLHHALEQSLQGVPFDALIHCAAVSDYKAVGVYAPSSGTRFDPQKALWSSARGEPPTFLDRMAGKVKSDEPELWLRLARTPKLIDLVRATWGFHGILVKFKLEAGISEDDLRDIAERSRRQSQADLLVANTLEGMKSWALVGPVDGRYERVERAELAPYLLSEIERLQKERGHG
jgi:phosphopantothenoylcysteine synthetase/decarboxylase